MRRLATTASALALALAVVPAAQGASGAATAAAQATDGPSSPDEAATDADPAPTTASTADDAVEELAAELQRNADDAERNQQALQLTEEQIAEAAEALALIEHRLSDAERDLAVAEGQLALGEQAAQDAEATRQVAEANLARADEQLVAAQDALEAEEEQLRDQVASTYKYGTAQQSTLALRLLGQFEQPDELAHNLYQLRSVLDWQQTSVERVDELRQQRVDLTTEAAELHDVAVSARRDAAAALEIVQRQTELARDLQASVRADRSRQQLVIDQLERNADALRAVEASLVARRGEIEGDLAQARGVGAPVDGLVCLNPIGTASFINDWGFPRSGGRTHKGTDVFATTGTPVYAMGDGTVRRVDRTDTYVVGSGRGDLGGRSVSIFTASNEYWYYAHLDTVVDGLSAGDTVEQGQLIGTVGNSGNARTTPPHTHVGRYVNGAAVNPFPTLDELCR